MLWPGLYSSDAVDQCNYLGYPRICRQTSLSHEMKLIGEGDLRPCRPVPSPQLAVAEQSYKGNIQSLTLSDHSDALPSEPRRA